MLGYLIASRIHILRRDADNEKDMNKTSLTLLILSMHYVTALMSSRWKMYCKLVYFQTIIQRI